MIETWLEGLSTGDYVLGIALVVAGYFLSRIGPLFERRVGNIWQRSREKIVLRKKEKELAHFAIIRTLREGRVEPIVWVMSSIDDIAEHRFTSITCMLSGTTAFALWGLSVYSGDRSTINFVIGFGIGTFGVVSWIAALIAGRLASARRRDFHELLARLISFEEYKQEFIKQYGEAPQ